MVSQIVKHYGLSQIVKRLKSNRGFVNQGLREQCWWKNLEGLELQEYV